MNKPREKFGRPKHIHCCECSTDSRRIRPASIRETLSQPNFLNYSGCIGVVRFSWLLRSDTWIIYTDIWWYLIDLISVGNDSANRSWTTETKPIVWNAFTAMIAATGTHLQKRGMKSEDISIFLLVLLKSTHMAGNLPPWVRGMCRCPSQTGSPLHNVHLSSMFTFQLNKLRHILIVASW